MTIVENKKAYFNYEILEKLEAGILLEGHEVKAIKTGKMTLQGSYISIRKNEAYLINAHIAPYQKKNTPADYNLQRDRKLLLSSAEIKELLGKSTGARLTIVPLRVYTKKARIKIEIALARGKRKYDKREAIKKHETEREIERTIKTRG